MKRKDIKVWNLYYIAYEKSAKGEFRDRHLAVVLKKNEDEITIVSVPLTSKPSKIHNKFCLGKLDCLSERLRNVDFYAVLDQIRTVNINKIEPILENNKPIDASLNDSLFIELWYRIVKELLFDMDNPVVMAGKFKSLQDSLLSCFYLSMLLCYNYCV